MTTQRRTPDSSHAHRRRHLGLQQMLLAGQRDMQAVLQRRVHRVSHDGSGGGLDDTEHAEAGIQDDLDAALIQMKRDTLQGVQDALGRLDAGGDGCCAECEAEIGTKRLQVQPFAVRCIKCQEAHERRVAGERPRRTPEGFDWR